MSASRLLGIAAACAQLGCATVINSAEQQILISSTPAGASVRIFDAARDRDIAVGATPYSVELPRGGGCFRRGLYRVTVSKPGYAERTLEVRAQNVSLWYVLGNLVIGGLVGWIVVDPSTGAMWELAPTVARVDLVEGEGEPAP